MQKKTAALIIVGECRGSGYYLEMLTPPVGEFRLGDKGYEAELLRRSLPEVGTTLVIPTLRNGRLPICYDQEQYRSDTRSRRFLPLHGRPPQCHSLQQAHCQIPVRRDTRNLHRLLARNGSGPRSSNNLIVLVLRKKDCAERLYIFGLASLHPSSQ